MKWHYDDLPSKGGFPCCETAYGAMMAETYDPYANYKIHIESAICISAKYNL